MSLQQIKYTVFIPPKIVITKKCPRCQLRYPWRERQCIHCYALSDHDIEKLKLRYKKEHKGNANLGRLFIYIAILLAIGIAII